MFAVVVTFTLAPGAAEDFLRLVTENAANSLRDEPGCHVFDIATDPERPDEVFLYELYTDAEAFRTHLDSRHFARFDAATAAMVAGKDVRTYGRVIR